MELSSTWQKSASAAERGSTVGGVDDARPRCRRRAARNPCRRRDRLESPVARGVLGDGRVVEQQVAPAAAAHRESRTSSISPSKRLPLAGAAGADLQRRVAADAARDVVRDGRDLQRLVVVREVLRVKGDASFAGLGELHGHRDEVRLAELDVQAGEDRFDRILFASTADRRAGAARASAACSAIAFPVTPKDQPGAPGRRPIARRSCAPRRLRRPIAGR